MKIMVTAEEYNNAARAHLGEVWFQNRHALMSCYMELDTENGTVAFDLLRLPNGERFVPEVDQEETDEPD